MTKKELHRCEDAQPGLEHLVSTYGAARDRALGSSVQAAEESERAVVGLQRRAAGRVRVRRMQRTGSVLVPALLALALGLQMWATDSVVRLEEEQALATLLLLDEPTFPEEAWDDPLTLMWEE